MQFFSAVFFLTKIKHLTIGPWWFHSETWFPIEKQSRSCIGTYSVHIPWECSSQHARDHQDYIFRIGDPYVNFHLPLASWGFVSQHIPLKVQRLDISIKRPGFSRQVSMVHSVRWLFCAICRGDFRGNTKQAMVKILEEQFSRRGWKCLPFPKTLRSAQTLVHRNLSFWRFRSHFFSKMKNP